MKSLNKLYKSTLIISFTVFSFGLNAGNEDRIGSAGASELLVNPWARSTAMGSAGIASTRGLEAQFVNVAGLAFTEKTQVKFNYTNWLGSARVALNSAGIAQRIGDQNVIGISVQAFDYGDIDITTVNIPEGGIGQFSPVKSIVNLAFAREFSNSIYAGLNLKVINENISNLRANGVALDAGVNYVTGEQDHIRFGITLKNVGPTMVYRGDGLSSTIFYQANGQQATLEQRSASFEMPSLLSIGASYDFIFSEGSKLTVAGGFIANSFTNDQYSIGFDYGVNTDKVAFNLRAGYVFEEDIISPELRTNSITGPTAGFSVDALTGKNKNPLGFEYAARLSDPFGVIHTVGLTISMK